VDRSSVRGRELDVSDHLRWVIGSDESGAAVGSGL
jgi:hypothetical protein